DYDNVVLWTTGEGLRHEFRHVKGYDAAGDLSEWYVNPAGLHGEFAEEGHLGYRFTTPDATVYRFKRVRNGNSITNAGRLESITDRNGNQLVVGYADADATETASVSLRHLAEVASAQLLTFTWESGAGDSTRIASVTDVSAGSTSHRQWTYHYNAFGNTGGSNHRNYLSRVTSPEAEVAEPATAPNAAKEAYATLYTYYGPNSATNDLHRLRGLLQTVTRVTVRSGADHAGGIRTYDYYPNRKVRSVVDLDGAEARESLYAYDLLHNETTVVDARGTPTRIRYATDGHERATVAADGARTSQQWTGLDEVGVYIADPDYHQFRLDLDGTRRQYEMAPDSDRNKLDGRPVDFSVGRDDVYPVVGDWNGDGRDNLGLFWATSGIAYFKLDSNGSFSQDGDGKDWRFEFKHDGVVFDNSARPVAGDWDGDGRADVGVYMDGQFYLDLNGSRRVDEVLSYGESGDLPVIGDWDGDGRDQLGVMRYVDGDGAYFYLDQNLSDPGGGTDDGDVGHKFHGRRSSFERSFEPIAGRFNNDAKTDIGISVRYNDDDGRRQFRMDLGDTDGAGHGDAVYKYGGQEVAASFTFTRPDYSTLYPVIGNFDGSYELLGRTTDALGRTTAFDYNDFGMITRQVDFDGLVTSSEYQPASYQQPGSYGQVTERVVHGTSASGAPRPDPFGGTATDRVTSFFYDGAGNLSGTIDPAGNATAMGYDGYGRLGWSVRPLGVSAVMGTDANGAAVRLGTTVRSTDDRYITRYGYAQLSGSGIPTNLIGLQTNVVEVQGGGLQTLIVSRTYDKSGHLTKQYDGSLTSDGAPRYTEHAVNVLGMVLRTTHSADQGAGAGTQASATSTFEYRDGLMVRATDAAGRVTETRYDRLDRPVQVVLADGSRRTTTYDDEGNVLSVTDESGNVTGYHYDARGRLHQTTRPDGGVERVRRDAAGNVVARVDAADRATTYQYDGRDRVTAEHLPPPGASGPAVGPTLFYYDDRGLRLKANPLNATRYDLDSLGRAVTTHDVVALGTWAPLPETRTTTVVYDPNGNVVKRTESGAADVPNRVAEFQYDLLDRKIKEVAPDPLTGSAGGRDPLTGVFVPAAGSAITTYSYDGAGNVLTTTSPLGNAPSASNDQRTAHTRTFQYDALGRKTAEQGHDNDDVSGNPGWTTYAYDAAGNLASVTNPRGHLTTYEYDVRGRRTKQVDHDPNTDGNGSDDAVTTYGHDRSGNLLWTLDPRGNAAPTDEQALHRVTYGYDAMNRRTLERGAANDNGARPTVQRFFGLAGEQVATVDPLDRAEITVYDGMGRAAFAARGGRRAVGAEVVADDGRTDDAATGQTLSLVLPGLTAKDVLLFDPAGRIPTGRYAVTAAA
ncbi:MAG TPA: hypothetical protein VK324_01685, partial [Tepidisphaeraceae bacterium]|nr:hypothetical protein [Tepidisphaeraceae bacterium]